MKIRSAALLIALAIALPNTSLSAGLAPWQFGMTKEQVKSFKEFAPYRTFKNGDLETFKGQFHGRKENVQFFFAKNRLVRIGVYLWEGNDRNKAIATFRQAYDILNKEYGKVVVPEIHADKHSAPLNPDVLSIAAAANAWVAGYTHIFPLKQPKDMKVSAAIMTNPNVDRNWFAIAIFFDPH